MANFISNIISSGCKFGIFSWISTLNNQKRTHNAFRIIRQLIIIFVFLRQILRRTMTKLSVNINKIATLRNARGGNVPDVVKVALDCEDFGADGITVHPRPDERHIRRKDVYDLRPLLRTEFNIEGYPAPEFMDLVLCPPRSP